MIKKILNVGLCCLFILMIGFLLNQNNHVKEKIPYGFQGTYQDPNSKMTYIIIDENQQTMTYLDQTKETENISTFLKIDEQVLLIQDNIFQSYIILLDRDGIRLLNPDIKSPSITFFEKKSEKLLSIYD